MSDAPSPSSFGYTFDGLADVIEKLLLKELGLERFGLFVQGYGGPVGFRIATRHPERIGWPVVQNSTEAPLRGFLTPSAARWIYTEVARDPGHVSPDPWVVDLAALARPEGDRIQLDLFYDDRTNVAQYPEWQAYLRTQKPPTLVVWGKNDPIFTPEGAHAFQPDLPEAELHLLDTGHFAPEEDLETIAALMKDFTFVACGEPRRGARAPPRPCDAGCHARDIMRVAKLWRYPVKSLAGEQIDGVDVTAAGTAGDQIAQVRKGRDRGITSRTAPRLLALRGTSDATAGEPLVNGLPWQSPLVAEAVRRAAGAGARLVRFNGVQRFDVLPLLVATDGAIARLGVDHRRLRPNVVNEGVGDLAERQWPGRRRRLGRVVIEVASVRTRCMMTTYDPDTQEQDLGVLRRIVNGFGGRIALDGAVMEGGRLTVGDPVEVIA